MEFPNPDLIKNPMLDLRYEIVIHARPADVFPWLKQVGYHRGGWYIDTWWDKYKCLYCAFITNSYTSSDFNKCCDFTIFSYFTSIKICKISNNCILTYDYIISFIIFS